MNKRIDAAQAESLAEHYLLEAIEAMKAFKKYSEAYDNLAVTAGPTDLRLTSLGRKAEWHRERVNTLTSLHQSLIMHFKRR